MTLRWYHWLLLVLAFVGLLLVTTVGFVIYGLVSGDLLLADGNATLWLTIVSELGFGAVVLMVGPFRRLAAPFWRLGERRWTYLARITGLGLLAVLAGQWLTGVAEALWQLDLTQPGFTDAVPAAAARGLGPILLTVLGMAILPAVAEEYLFRGAIFHGLRRRWPFWASALVSSLLFGALHMPELSWSSGLPLALVTAWIGLVNAYLTEKSGSLWPAVVVHLINNGWAVFALAMG